MKLLLIYTQSDGGEHNPQDTVFQIRDVDGFETNEQEAKMTVMVPVADEDAVELGFPRKKLWKMPLSGLGAVTEADARDVDVVEQPYLDLNQTTWTLDSEPSAVDITGLLVAI